MKKKYLLDAYAVLAWIQVETGAQFVEDLLYRARENEQEDLPKTSYRGTSVNPYSFA